jgi:hypothetical protein
MFKLYRLQKYNVQYTTKIEKLSATILIGEAVLSGEKKLVFCIK